MVDVGDVISSVRTIMASQMAQREQEQSQKDNPVVAKDNTAAAASGVYRRTMEESVPAP